MNDTSHLTNIFNILYLDEDSKSSESSESNHWEGSKVMTMSDNSEVCNNENLLSENKKLHNDYMTPVPLYQPMLPSHSKNSFDVWFLENYEILWQIFRISNNILNIEHHNHNDVMFLYFVDFMYDKS